MQNDIEFAITDLDNSQQKLIVGMIPRSFTAEDRSSTGYGLVIRSTSSESSEEISKKLELFFDPLLPLAKLVADRNCIVRVAIFSSFVTTTATFTHRSLEILGMFNAKLEVSVYPTDEEPE